MIRAFSLLLSLLSLRPLFEDDETVSRSHDRQERLLLLFPEPSRPLAASPAPGVVVVVGGAGGGTEAVVLLVLLSVLCLASLLSNESDDGDQRGRWRRPTVFYNSLLATFLIFMRFVGALL